MKQFFKQQGTILALTAAALFPSGCQNSQRHAADPAHAGAVCKPHSLSGQSAPDGGKLVFDDIWSFPGRGDSSAPVDDYREELTFAGRPMWTPRNVHTQPLKVQADRFASDLGRTFSSERVDAWLITGAVVGGAFLLEGPVDSWFRDEKPLEGLKDVGNEFGDFRYVPLASIAFLTAGEAADSPRLRDTGYAILESGAAAGVIVTALKGITQRERPNGSDNHSFPSGHTATAFSLATTVSSMSDWDPAVTIASHGLAALTAAARIQDDQHHLADVAMGAAVGSITAYVVSELYKDNPDAGWPFLIKPFVTTDYEGDLFYGVCGEIWF